MPGSYFASQVMQVKIFIPLECSRQNTKDKGMKQLDASSQLCKPKHRDQSRIRSETANILKLSVISSLNHFRLQVTATGVVEAEHKECSQGGCEDRAETTLAQVAKKVLRKSPPLQELSRSCPKPLISLDSQTAR